MKKFIDSLAIVIDLAEGNVLEKNQCDDAEMRQERTNQLRALRVVKGFLETIRGFKEWLTT